MTSPLALSDRARTHVRTFGSEQQPVLVVDDVLADLSLVRGIAARHSFRPIGPHYPGIRAAVSERVVMPLADPLTALLTEIFALDRAPHYAECFLSVVTKGGGDLAPIQRLPHFDGTERGRIAVLLYLGDTETHGTGFYRQRSTGFESVTADRFAAYEKALRDGVAEHGLPVGYIGEGNALFDRIFAVRGRANRLIAYRGNTLHCAALPEGFAPDADPRRGRLTLNLFLSA
ncbi:DUF6445 family protein [Aurantiacibacter spongiae]|uniref:Uncharacterized protein n=1 Tax=Aurantiacibacter spongiae TaxID=2488860 RepID=A0A3N5CXD6_9SPHN|nr:DUF6445 family protein [Aurantiacibacter spongiae]RPF72260.1 hypothetical protein EG799_11970 [Aurantiacibacter spongiae]